MSYILDASALLALLLGEPGEARMREVLDDCFIHAINLAEVVTKLELSGVRSEEVVSSIAELHLPVDECFSEQQAVECGRLARITREFGLSLGGRVCLSAARSHRAAVLTTDRCWADLSDLGLSIEVIR